MSDVLIPTLVPIVVAVVGALVTVVYGPILKARRDRRRQAEDLEARYRGELMACAFALQARLYNISAEDLLAQQDYFESEVQAESQGLWMVGRYLAWVELLRRDNYFLALGTTSRGRGMLQSIAGVTNAFASDIGSLIPQIAIFASSVLSKAQSQN
jgi:hypothetical protein